MNAVQQFIASAISNGAMNLIPEGTVLKSGRVSPYFFNSAKYTSGSTMGDLATAYARKLHNLKFDTIYGPPYKGIPLAATVAVVMHQKYCRNVRWSSSRKEAKQHGEGGIGFGGVLRSRNVMIIDDVITTGNTKDEALNYIQSEGGKVVGIVIAFDRQEAVDDSGLSAAQLFEKQHGVPVHAAATLDDLIAVLKQNPKLPGNNPEILRKILAYRDQYGAK